jgi:hypothetical protein
MSSVSGFRRKRLVATAYETREGGNMFLMRQAPFDGAFKAWSCG